MKSVYFFSSRLWVYLTELPIFILLAVAIAYNGQSEETFRHYPLIVFLILAAAFIFVYFFRFISVSTDEIRYHGIFSSRDSALITEKKTLVLTLDKHRKMRLDLFGDAGEEPIFDWMKAEDVIHRDICIFRGKAIGGNGAALRLLKYFALDNDALDGCFEDGFSYGDERISISTSAEDKITKIEIKFKITIV